jgi:hypothetical protein
MIVPRFSHGIKHTDSVSPAVNALGGEPNDVRETSCHEKDFLGIPATGRKIVIIGLSVHWFAAGKIVESWDYPDYMGMMQQLTGP